MPRQSRLTRGYDRRAILWTQVASAAPVSSGTTQIRRAGARRSTAVATRKTLRDHAAVRHAWFNGDMYIKGRVEGVQIPRQLRLNSGYACPAIGWTRVCRVPRYYEVAAQRPFPIGRGPLACVARDQICDRHRLRSEE